MNTEIAGSTRIVTHVSGPDPIVQMRSNEKKQVRVPCTNRAFMDDIES